MSRKTRYLRCFPTVLSFPADPNGKVAADLWLCGAGKIDLPSIGGEGDPHLDEIRRRDDSWGEYHGLIVGILIAVWSFLFPVQPVVKPLIINANKRTRPVLATILTIILLLRINNNIRYIHSSKKQKVCQSALLRSFIVYSALSVLF